MYFTDHFTPNSTAVREAWYDARTNELAVKMKGSNSTYLYKGVNAFTWNALCTAVSAGSYFAYTIKPTFGPGKRLYDVPQARTPDFKVGDRVRWTSPNDGHYAAVTGAFATVTSNSDYRDYLYVTWDRTTNDLAKTQGDGGYNHDCFELVEPTEAAGFAVGTRVQSNQYGQGVVVEPHSDFSPNTFKTHTVVKFDNSVRLFVSIDSLTEVVPEPVVESVSKTDNLVSLATVASEATVTGARYTVRFEVDGVLREYTSNFNNVGAALIAVGNIGNALDLTFVIKSVERFFD